MNNFYNQEQGFVPIKGYESDYKINNEGKVLSLLTDQYIEHHVDTKGYLVVYLNKDGVTKTHRLHRLVAQAFIPNPNNLPAVNHIDGNKQNPHYTNLEWCTLSENTLHAYRTGLKTSSNTKEVLRGDGKVYSSVSEAARDTGIDKSAISRVINGKRKTAGGYTWSERMI